MTEDQRELHLPDALTHAAVPPADKERLATPDAALSVESGPVLDRMEDLFPLVWLGMLTVVSVVGIYNAVSKLPDPTPFF
ncbi:MAG TPA: hypothetical protein VIT93_01785 [Dehalococcoidia bacterium]